jgi:uncharacterized protein (TIGR02117 family)
MGSRTPANRRAFRIFLWAAAAVATLPVLYFIFAAMLGVTPANPGWRQPEDGVRIFIRSNGVHTWIMLPAVTEDKDWRLMAPAHHIADSRYAGDYMAFGYGNRRFYLNTPTWGDLTLSDALHAGFRGGPTLLHVDHDRAPQPDEWQRPITISRVEHRALIAFIEAHFQLSADGDTMPLIGRGYGPSDIFYEAVGHYDLYLTCNEWTGRALRAAGINTGLWTPLAQSIMWRLD